MTLVKTAALRSQKAKNDQYHAPFYRPPKTQKDLTPMGDKGAALTRRVGFAHEARCTTEPYQSDPVNRVRPHSMSRRFNSRARMGRDDNKMVRYDKVYMFQFTRPHGARLSAASPAASAASFNSRARMGRDYLYTDAPAPYIVSIHAPAWGATTSESDPGFFSWKFQFTRPHGARRQQDG